MWREEEKVREWAGSGAGEKRKGGRRIKTYDTGSGCSRLPGFRCNYTTIVPRHYQHLNWNVTISVISPRFSGLNRTLDLIPCEGGGAYGKMSV